ncbi:MAG TPA: GNAT family N-acetyltransferase [Kofleriaceae bacterium]|nr:GNAT family N-acetyltransferase [Kofleriaceae bacterium]
MPQPIAIRELRDDERAWADERYRAIRFATTPSGSVALVAERAGARIGLGRLVAYPDDVVELGGIWTDEAARGAGVARAMVTALLARAAAAPPRGRLWCIPFGHLAAFYQSFGFAPVAPPWPPPVAAKVEECIAHALPAVVVLAW